MKVIVCPHCNREAEIHFETDEDLFDEPVFCPFCGEVDGEAELLLEDQLALDEPE